ncbi:MAG: hypothetical protein MK135_13360 [Polyangiaceae bacterium]|nr:hypothetical protein [Polyangiaceae bacterium]
MESTEISPESPFFGVPQPIVELAQSLADFVEKAVGIRPDFDPDTLPLVDHYAREVREQLKERPELLDLAAQALGAYFGEVFRRSANGFWKVPSSNYNDWLICGTHAYVALNPIGVGYDAIVGSQNHHGPSSGLKLAPEDRASLDARLAALPQEKEEDFYSLSTRLEVLQIVHAGVEAEAEKRGYSEQVYDAEDYGDELRTLGG